MKKTSSLHRRSWRYTATAVGLSLATASLSFAQSVNESVDSEDVIELSPFTVSAEENSGYQATSTLAGTRIKTDIKDLGAAISVVTKEFLEDTGATSLEDLFQYTTSTEIGGVNGNYSASDLNAGGGRVDQDASRREPQAGGRIRGLARPNYTRNYFSTSIPIDRYNTGQITISRGPNSLLFGLGSAGGVVDAGLGTASLGRDKNRVQVRFDNNGSTRGEMDLNKVLIKDRLAVQVSGLYEDLQYRQKYAEKLTKRVFASFNAVLRKPDSDAILGRTSLKGNIEFGEEEMTPPDSLPPSLAWDSFFVPPPDYRPYTGTDYRQTFDVLNNGFVKWGTLDTRRSIDSTGKVTPGYNELTTPLHSTSHIFGQLGLVFATPGGAPTPVTPNGSVGFQGWINGGGGLPFTNPFVNTRSYNETDGSTGFKNFSLTDTNVFDFRNNLLTGSMQQIDKLYDSQAITLEQILFGGRGGIEVTYGEEYYKINRFQPFGGGGRDLPIYIDTSEWLSDNVPNPNVGRAFLLAQGETDEWQEVNRENTRATAFYNLDFSEFSEGLGKWLGRHTLTGLYQNEDRINTHRSHGKYWAPYGSQNFKRDVWGQPNNSNDTSFAGQVVQFAYISDDLRGVEQSAARLYAANYPVPTTTGAYQMLYYDAQDKAYREGSFNLNRYVRRAGTPISRTQVESEAFAWQSYLFNDNIVGLAGWRSDEISSFTATNFNPNTGNNTLDVEKAYDLNTTPNSVQKGDTFTWSVVGHLPQSWVDKVPLFSSISAHYGDSENFSAIRQRNDIRNNPISNPAGITEEMGITLGFLEDKWNLRLTKYETSQALDGISNDKSFQAINEITRALNNYKSAELGGQDFSVHQAFTKGIKSYDEIYTKILGLLPAETQAIYQYAFDPVAGEFDNQGQIEGISATTDRVAKGYEMELVGNPTPNWRVLVNVAKTETLTSNTAEETFLYATNHLAALDAAGLSDVNESPSGIVTMKSRYRNEVFSPLVAARAKDGTVSQEQREWRVNLVNNYSFREGRLKGVSVGGAIRYQSEVATGYNVKIDEFGNQVPLVDQPFWGPAEFNGDAWVSYSKKLSEKLDWKIQLNVRNLIGSQDLIPVFTNPDGQDAIFRIPGERSWFITNTFTF